MSKCYTEKMVRTIIDIWEGTSDINRAVRLLDTVVTKGRAEAHAAGRREMGEEAARLHETMLCKPRGVCSAERNATLTEYAEAIRALPDTPGEPTVFWLLLTVLAVVCWNCIRKGTRDD